MDPNNIGGSAAAGSSTTGPNINLGNSGTPTGQPASGGERISYEQYKELEKKLGSQGQELGEYRQFFQSISPVLDKLDQSPELVQAILDGKVDKELAKAVYDGKVTIQDAEVVTQAYSEVKEDLGDKKYEAMSPDKIADLVDKKVQEVRRELEEKAELGDFQEKTQAFIGNTPDFAEHADKIDKWLDEHDVTDIEVAYWAVKGKLSEEAAKKVAEVAEGERAKDVALNATGGGVYARYAPDGTALIDKLIGGSSNPNEF